MEKYTLYCTPEQTRKAFELGAPIGKYDGIMTLSVSPEEELYQMPTAEQMLGWLEEQDLSIDVTLDNTGYKWSVWEDNRNNVSKRLQEMYPHHLEMVEFRHYIPTRKEATLAAIDAALEYLTNNKK